MDWGSRSGRLAMRLCLRWRSGILHLLLYRMPF